MDYRQNISAVLSSDFVFNFSKANNLMISCTFVPDGFRYNYIVPIPKPEDCYSKYLTCDNFRGIAISPVLSKVFEHCLLDRYKSFLNTCWKGG